MSTVTAPGAVAGVQPARRRGRALVVLGVGLAIIAALQPAAGRPARATHGAETYPRSGTWGSVAAAPIDCFAAPARIVMYPPYSVLASYDTTNRPAQRVWWTPRVWWRLSDGTFGHTTLRPPEWGWHQTWAHTGDNHGGLIPFPERGSIGGGAYRPWSDESGATHSHDWAALAYVNLDVARVFIVEYIYYFEANAQQPQDGWVSHLVRANGPLLNLEDGCSF